MKQKMPRLESLVENPVKIAALVLGFSLLFSLMSIFVKLATNAGVPIVHIMFWRFAFGLIPVVGYLKYKNTLRTEFVNKEWWPLGARAFMGMIAMWCTFQSFAMLPVAEATALHFASPFFMTLLSIPLLGEKVGPWRWSAIVGGFIGVLFVLRPDMGGAFTGQFIALCAALIMAMNMLLVRTLSKRVTAQGLTLYFHLVGALCMLPFVVLDWQVPSGEAWLYLAVAGASAGIAQILLNNAYLTAPAAFVGAFSYMQIIFVTLGGWLVFHHVPSHSFLWGASIIVAGGVLIAVREALLHKKNRLIEEPL